MVDGGSPDQPLPNQPPQEDSTFTEKPNELLINKAPPLETIKENNLNPNEWDRLLQLDEMSPSQLMKNPDTLNEFMGLRAKGKQDLENNFDTELARRKNVVAKEKEKRIGDGIGQMEDLASQAMREAHGILEGSDRRNAERNAQLDKALARFQEKVQPKRADQILAEAQNNPGMKIARANLDWNTLLVGKPVEGTDPELVGKINALKQNANARIMTDPKGWQAEYDVLQEEFFRSRGIELPSNPKPNTV